MVKTMTEKTFEEVKEELPSVALNTLVATVITSGGLSAVNHSVHYGAKTTQKFIQSRREQALLDKLINHAADNKTADRVPDVYTDLVNQNLEGTGAEG